MILVRLEDNTIMKEMYEGASKAKDSKLARSDKNMQIVQTQPGIEWKLAASERPALIT